MKILSVVVVFTALLALVVTWRNDKPDNELSLQQLDNAVIKTDAFMEIANLNVLDLKPGVKVSIDEEASQKVYKNMLSLPSDQNKDICVRTYRMIFDDIDTNNDGGTSEDEFTEFLFIIKALSPWPGITDIKIVSIAWKSMEMFDADKDNKISREEY